MDSERFLDGDRGFGDQVVVRGMKVWIVHSGGSDDVGVDCCTWCVGMEKGRDE